MLINLTHAQADTLAWDCSVGVDGGYVLMDERGGFWLADAADYAYWLHTYRIPQDARRCGLLIEGRRFRWSGYGHVELERA